jgi:hypothetical protein
MILSEPNQASRLDIGISTAIVIKAVGLIIIGVGVTGPA